MEPEEINTHCDVIQEALRQPDSMNEVLVQASLVELLRGFLVNVSRIADAAEKLSTVVKED